MTHKIKVQMFGNFRMDYNGAPFVAEKMHKESQFNRMMQALIHYSDCGIAKDKLEEIVIGERDIDAPHAEYIKLYHNVKNIQKLILDGAYTRKTLQDAIIEVLENACTPVENRYQDHI